MALQRRLVGLTVALVLLCVASEDTDDKTTEAVLKAVVQAENKPRATPKNAQEAEDAKITEEASAVAKATTEVLDSETSADSVVSKGVIEIAADNAKKTFKDLADDGVAPKAAADAAARVAVETVDGASDLAMPHEAKVNAEKAAIAAGQAVADHPDSSAEALLEAVSTVKKEEKTPGKALQKEKSKGIVSQAGTVVSDEVKLVKAEVKLAEDGASSAEEKVGTLGSAVFFLIIVALVVVFIGLKNFEAAANNTPYLKRLRAIREESDGAPAEYERGLIDTPYHDYSEMEQCSLHGC